MKKIISLVLALAMVLSIATTSASAFGFLGCKDNNSTSLIGKVFNIGNIFSADEVTSLIPTLNFCDILANVEKSIQGTGLVYGRDYKITVDADDTLGYRIHLIQPVSGNTLYDNYLLYKDGEWTWEKAWNVPTVPTLDQFNLDNIKNNIYTALWDSGIYVNLDEDVTVTRESEDGFKVLIIDPITGREIYNKEFVIEDSKTISWTNEFEPIAEDSILAAHFPTTDEAEEEMKDEGEKQIEEPVVIEEPVEEPVVTPVEEPTEAAKEEPTTEAAKEEPTKVVVEEPATEKVVDETPLADKPAVTEKVVDNTPLADAPAADEIANTGDTVFSAMAAVTVLAGAAFVASTKKHN